MSYRFGYEHGPFEVYSGEAYPSEAELFSAYENFEGGLPGIGGAPAVRGGSAPGPGLAPAVLNNALRANRANARQIGWGCIRAGVLSPIEQLRTLLGLAVGATEAEMAQAIARYQQGIGQPATGQLGPRTWAQMLRPGRPGQPVIPALGFRRASWPVFFQGRKLGVIEKTAPYLATNDGTSGGASIQIAFRVTNIDAVTRARFVDGTGEDQFRWVQVITTNRPNQDGVDIRIRRFRKYIDPGAGARDRHPYYWDEAGQGDPRFRINAFINRSPFDAIHPNSSRLCYDLIFEDLPTRPLAFADPRRRVFWNAEIGLIGVRPGNRNVILNTVNWGFDIVINAGAPGVKLNALSAGPTGGSSVFRQVMSRAISAGTFPGHCFFGLPGTAGCR